MKKKVSLVMLFVFLLLLTGCTKQEKHDANAYQIEYLNKEKTKIVRVDYEPTANDTKGLIDELIEQLETDPGSVEYRKTIPNDVQITSYDVDGALLTLHFSDQYSSMEPSEEVLRRAAIVRTLTQIDGIDCVTFYVGDTPLSDGNGNLIGAMTQDSFIENPGEQINSIQNATLTLYFSNNSGDGLIKETRNVYYSSNISLEKLILEQLLEGPKGADAKSAIPEGTNLVNVSVVDGVCYVSLDETFRNQNYEISEPIVIYSIVDSLSELPTISKVQISVNGDTKGTYRDSFELDKLYDRNLDYVVSKESDEELSDTETQQQ